MSRESRLVVILLVIGGIGITGLLFVANQYRKALEGRGSSASLAAQDASSDAMRRVNGFIAARSAVKAVLARYPDTARGGPAAVDRYRIERALSLATRHVTYDEYAAVRSAWRRWRSGEALEDPALEAALSDRKAALASADLGPGESFDDAVN